jgi:hypothetical protein
MFSNSFQIGGVRVYIVKYVTVVVNKNSNGVLAKNLPYFPLSIKTQFCQNLIMGKNPLHF